MSDGDVNEVGGVGVRGVMQESNETTRGEVRRLHLRDATREMSEASRRTSRP